MRAKETSIEHYSIIKYLFRWTFLVFPVAISIGAAVAFFLWSLDEAIQFRFDHPWLLFLLPLSGVLIHFIYQSAGKSSEKGNNLVMEEIHEAGGGVPKRMAPVILVTTIITHLFGGSAGREGTAVQIGGSIASMFGKWFKLPGMDMRLILISGVAAGFGAVFGTPLTGAIFALEVLTIGRIQYDALLPALIASVIGDMTVALLGVHHTSYHIDTLVTSSYFLSSYLPVNPFLIVKVIAASAIFGLASYLFAGMVHEIKAFFLRIVKVSWFIPVIGGLIIIALTLLTGRTDYLSLGVKGEFANSVTIPSAFNAGGADTWSWLWKTVYTSITLATGFKGGEVTPLFFIGATLGNSLAGLLDAPVSLFAALGFIAVFAGATNTPLACTVMGIELFGGEYTLLFAIACFTAYFFSGHSGIYSSQRIAVPKLFDEYFSEETSLSESNKRRGYIHQKLSKYKVGGKKESSGSKAK